MQSGDMAKLMKKVEEHREECRLGQVERRAALARQRGGTETIRRHRKRWLRKRARWKVEMATFQGKTIKGQMRGGTFSKMMPRDARGSKATTRRERRWPIIMIPARAPRCTEDGAGNQGN
jgi:hypothetical protein